MDPSEAARWRRLFEDTTGQGLENVDLDEMRRVLREAGLPVDEPSQVAELEQRWLELQPAMLQAAVDPDVDAFLVVDPVFQAAMERLGPSASDPSTLAEEPAGIRAVVATRMVDGLVANGGWTAVFSEGQQGILPLAVDGYWLLGLEEHALLAAKAAGRAFTAVEPANAEEFAFWEELEGAWLDLPSPEAARAAYVGANPDIR
jgi:hypothetical protein